MHAYTSSCTPLLHTGFIYFKCLHPMMQGILVLLQTITIHNYAYNIATIQGIFLHATIVAIGTLTVSLQYWCYHESCFMVRRSGSFVTTHSPAPPHEISWL